MGLVNEYRRQLNWRDWDAVFSALPPLAGLAVLDLGCGVGDQAAELVARGVRVATFALTGRGSRSDPKVRVENAGLGDSCAIVRLSVAVGA